MIDSPIDSSRMSWPEEDAPSERALGLAIGTEARVLYNLGITRDLSLRGPQVNLQRDPRWGRNSNSPSEDPLVTARYGVNLVRMAKMFFEWLSGTDACSYVLVPAPACRLGVMRGSMALHWLRA